jgi:hypothetical protein
MEDELKERQKLRRAKDVEEFGAIGLKTKCPNYGKTSCRILTDLYCQYEVCHFYKKGE